MAAVNVNRACLSADGFVIRVHDTGRVYGIESIDTSPIECECIVALNELIAKNTKHITKLKLHLSADSGYKYDADVLHSLSTAFNALFHQIGQCTNLEAFEFSILQIPHNVIQDFIDTILMNEHCTFARLSSFSIDINEHLLIFMHDFYGYHHQQLHSENEMDFFSKLNIYSSFLLRHKACIQHIHIQVNLSPTIVMNYYRNVRAHSLQSILSIVIWRLLGALYFSEIELVSFYFWCRYNVDINKLIPLLMHMIEGNCRNLEALSLNCSHLQSNHIERLLKCMLSHCNAAKLNSFTLNALDTDNHIATHKFFTMTKSANVSLQRFLGMFGNLRYLSLNCAQFQPYQYNQLIAALSKTPNLEQLVLGDCCFPGITFGFDLYDNVNIWYTFIGLMENIGKSLNLNSITVNVEKLDVATQFVKKNTMLVDCVYKLYYDLNQQITTIYNEILVNWPEYPKEIIYLIIEFTCNHSQELTLSVQGSPRLLDAQLNTMRYIEQFYHENAEIYSIVQSDVPIKNISMTVNGVQIVSTKSQSK